MMAARAIWKGMIEFEDVEVPVKLYSAVTDRTIHFRLLHEPDLTPIEQRMVNPVTGKIVPTEKIIRGVETEDGIVILDEEELQALEPEPSRTIEIVQFVPPETIDHRWYLRPYWVGPDESGTSYFGLARALEKSGLEGVARWTMRSQRYRGALRVREGRLLLIALRPAEEVVSMEEIGRPAGRSLDRKERELAEKLIETMSDTFEPEHYEDEYRRRVLELIEAKASGRTIRFPRPERKQRAGSLAETLEASLERARERSVA